MNNQMVNKFGELLTEISDSYVEALKNDEGYASVKDYEESNMDRPVSLKEIAEHLNLLDIMGGK